MKNKTHIIYIAVIAILLSVTISIVLVPTPSKLAYINIAEVFEQFQLKKELTNKFEKSAIARDELLNDMYMGLEKLAKEIEANPTQDAVEAYRKKEAIYYQKKEAFETQKATQLEEYDAQIIKQLNQYVNDYGQKEGVDVILGANNQGNLMYCNEDMNITNEVITYINNRYTGETNN